MALEIIITFIPGFLAVTLEQTIKINKAASVGYRKGDFFLVLKTRCHGSPSLSNFSVVLIYLQQHSLTD